MFPPPFSSESILLNESISTDDLNPLTHAYHDVIIYEDVDADDVLYEGPIVVHANGWVELEGNRLLSPSAIHHIDIYDDQGADVDAEDGPSDDDDRGGGHDDYRTSRFTP